MQQTDFGEEVQSNFLGWGGGGGGGGGFLDICPVDIYAYVLQFLLTDEFIQLFQHPCWSDLILVVNNLLENRNFTYECT